MYKFILLALGLSLSMFTVTVEAKPVTIKMTKCGGDNIRTISTNCKNQAAGFTLRYTMKEYGDYGSLLRIYNPTARNIRIDQVELFNGHNERCELDSWGPEGQTIYAKNNFDVMTSECRPHLILKYVFIIGNKRYIY